MFFKKKHEPTSFEFYCGVIRELYSQWEAAADAERTPEQQYREAASLRPVYKAAVAKHIKNAKECLQRDYEQKRKKKVSALSLALIVPVAIAIDQVTGLGNMPVRSWVFFLHLCVAEGGLAAAGYFSTRAVLNKVTQWWGDKHKAGRQKKEMQPFYSLLREYNKRAKDKMRRLENAHGAELLAAVPTLPLGSTAVGALERYKGRLLREQAALERSKREDVQQLYQGTQDAIATKGRLKLKAPSV